MFTLESEEEELPGIMAEDSNDIYILPSDNSGQVSPPESPTVTTSWQSESLPVSLSASQSWHTESLPVSLGPESWQQVALDPEEVKSLDSNGAGEKSENNSSNSDIVHVEKEELPEGMDEDAPAPLLELGSGMGAVEKVSPSTSLFVVLDEEELQAATHEPAGPAAALRPTQTRPSEELALGDRSAGEEAMALAQGKAALLFGGAAAVAILAMAVGVALALRKK